MSALGQEDQELTVDQNKLVRKPQSRSCSMSCACMLYMYLRMKIHAYGRRLIIRLVQPHTVTAFSAIARMYNLIHGVPEQLAETPFALDI